MEKGFHEDDNGELLNVCVLHSYFQNKLVEKGFDEDDEDDNGELLNVCVLHSYYRISLWRRVLMRMIKMIMVNY